MTARAELDASGLLVRVGAFAHFAELLLEGIGVAFFDVDLS